MVDDQAKAIAALRMSIYFDLPIQGREEAIKAFDQAVSISRASEGSRVVTTTNAEACKKIDALAGAFLDKDRDGFLHHGTKVREAIVEAFQIGRNIAALSPPATPQAPEDVWRRSFNLILDYMYNGGPPSEAATTATDALEALHLLNTPVTVTMEECQQIADMLFGEGLHNSGADIAAFMSRVLKGRIQIAGSEGPK